MPKKIKVEELNLRFGLEHIDYIKLYDSDFETIVKAVYPKAKDFSFALDQECGNDTVHKFEDIDGNMEEWDARDLAAFKRTGKLDREYMSNTFLHDLVKKKVLPAGNYLIWVCW